MQNLEASSESLRTVKKLNILFCICFASAKTCTLVSVFVFIYHVIFMYFSTKRWFFSALNHMGEDFVFRARNQVFKLIHAENFVLF